MGEGLFLKRRDAPCWAGRSAVWVKSKIARKGAFVSVGYHGPTARSIQTHEMFSTVVANILAEQRPKSFTATMAKSDRKGRIFIDWMRNDAVATVIAPFSLRARPGATVALPVTWQELGTLRRPNGFGMN